LAVNKAEAASGSLLSGKLAAGDTAWICGIGIIVVVYLTAFSWSAPICAAFDDEMPTTG
jgi:hypothetical protein